MNNGKLFSIGQISKLLEVPAYTLRYWEKEFSDFLHPKRSNGKQRKYGEYEIELLKKIKKMLKEEKYSIAGARQKLYNQLIGNDEEEKQEVLLKIAKLINVNDLTNNISLEKIDTNN